tara:strand:+ start:22708 stop:26193 length:3486 start_codon:yes stop_codon:yes gene_type:complete
MTEANIVHEANNILEPKKTKLIRDTPASSDSFGSHERVANAISHMVKNENGGIAIALEGSWGSGKSTVVNLLDRQTNDKLFVFDAWAHEGDPLRRVFIESLIDYCLPQMSIKDKTKWTINRDKLTKKVRRVTTETTPKSPILTALAIGYTAGLPIAVYVLGRAITSVAPFIWWQWLFFGYVLFPILLSFGIAINLLRIKYIKKRDKFTAKELCFFDFFQHKSSQTIKSDSIESSDTTSIEFQSYFTELMADHLNGTKDRKIVIVLDNLDRLPEDSALSIWSTLRVFMECWENTEKHKWADRSWLLVPYDRSAVNHLWGKLDNDPDKEKDKSNPETSPGTPAAFLDKTFQIRFEVPPLISADWKEYLIRLLHEAFPDHTDSDDQHKTYRISSLLAEEKKRPPTPRHLKLFVNDIGALRRQFHDKFPLHHLAYYAILKRKGVTIRSGLLYGTIPEEKYEYTLGESITESLAAICFNTLDTDQAQDLLLATPIRNALQNGDASELKELANRRGFWDVAETAIIDAPSDWGGDQSIASAATSAIQSSEIATVQNTASKSTIPQFINQMMLHTHWNSLDKTTAKGLSDSLRLLNTTAQAVNVSRVLTNFETPSVTDTETQTPDSVKEWVSNLVQVMKTCIELKHTGTVQKISTTATAKSLIYIFAELYKHASIEPAWIKLAPSIIDAKLITDLQPTTSVPYWSSQQADAMALFIATKSTASWGKIIDSITDTLSTAEVIPSHTIGDLIDALGILNNPKLKPTSVEARNQISTGGHFHHHLHRCKDDKSTLIAAKIIYQIGMHADLTTVPANIGDSAQGHSWLLETLASPEDYLPLIKQLVNILPVDNGKDFLSKLLRYNDSSNSFTARCYAELFSTTNPLAVLPPQHLRSNWSEIYSLLENRTALNYDDLLYHYIDKSSLLTDFQSSELILSEVDLHNDLFAHADSLPTTYTAWLVAQLKEIDKSDWLTSFHNEDEHLLLSLLTSLQNNKIEHNLGSNLQQAIKLSAKEIISNNWDGKLNDEHWESITNSISEDSLIMLGKSLLDEICKPSLEFSRETYFSRFGKIIAPMAECTDDKNLVYLVLLPIVEERSETGCQWIADQLNINVNLKCYNGAPKEHRIHFQTRITEIIDQQIEQLAPIAIEIAHALKIETISVKDNPNESEGH